MMHAVPGMVLAMPIPHPVCPEVILLRTGAVLDANTIPRLREIGVQEAWIRYPAFEHLVSCINPTVLASYRDLTTTIGQAIDGIVATSHAKLDYSAYRRGVVSVVDRIIDHPGAAVCVGEMMSAARPAVRHASNVCVLSILMGLKLEFYLLKERTRLHGCAAKDISGLGVGAMLSDVGMLRLPPHVLARWNAVHDETDVEWQKHVLIGYEMVKGELDAPAAGAVLHHHQKYDGSGFPRRRELSGIDHSVAGSEIHIFARIIACADLFDRLRNPADAPGADARRHPSRTIVHALSLMRQAPYRDWIDPVVFRALLTVMPPYPPGSMVELSNGMRAIVAKWFPADPCRPIVSPIDENVLKGKLSSSSRTPEKIDLRREPTLSISAIDGVPVGAHNFVPSHPLEFDLIAYAKAMDNKAFELGFGKPTQR